MLLPSAVTCDASHLPRTRLQSSLFSPPASPPTLSQSAPFVNILNSCRMLQSLTSTATITPPSTSPIANQLPMETLPTPPMTYAPSPLKLRLRARPTARQDGDAAPKRVTKRAQPVPSRGLNKRRRAEDDSAGREDDDSDAEVATPSRAITPTPQTGLAVKEPSAPSTPKRARIAPEVLPLGLERSDFHSLEGSFSSTGTDANADDRDNAHAKVKPSDGSRWSDEDDRMLVEVILEKLKLSKTEWQDCARNLGRDRHEVGRRWKSLISNGEVGLKRRRGKIHGTWR